MKNKFIQLALACSLPLSLWAQNNCTSANSDTAYLHGNEIKTIISADGNLFWDGNNAQYWVPYSSTASQQTSTIFAGGLWIGGYDAGGNLKMAAQTYSQGGGDYFYGPLDNSGNTDSSACNKYNKVWRVDAPIVEGHIQHYNANNGNVTQVDSILLAWPGKDNPHLASLLGFSLPANRDFAPFYDHNNDNIYDPFDGDYPVFEAGDAGAIAASMTWNIYNDNGNTHGSSNGQPLQIEVHQTSYALNCPNDPLLNHSIFIRNSVVSRNLVALSNVRAAVWLDFDLGCYADDYIGTAVAQDAVFAYNADDFDSPSCAGSFLPSYGHKPPVQSVKLLNQDIYKSMYYDNTTSPVNGNPGTALQHYRLINGQYMDGTTAPDYVYDGMPSDTSSSAWTMVNAAIPPADYRNLMVVNLDSLLPGSVHHIDAAYVYHRDTTLADNIEMTDLIYTELPMVQNWYDNGFPSSCFPALALSLRQAIGTEGAVRLYPNPNKGQFTLELPTDNSYQLRIFDMTGRLLQELPLQHAKQHQIELTNLAQGMYFYQVANGKESYSGKLVIKE